MTELELFNKELIELLNSLSEQKSESLEYRLYFDEDGKVITYTCDKLPGNNFIVVSKEQFAEARSDILVKNGKVVYTHKVHNTYKFELNSEEGIRCSKYDVSILVDETESEFNYWKMTVYEIV
jgi:hypothetical protein